MSDHDQLLARADWLLNATVQERMDAGIECEPLIADLRTALAAQSARSTPDRVKAAVTSVLQADLRTAATNLLHAIEDDEEGMDLGGYDHLTPQLDALRAALATREERPSPAP